MKRSDLAKLIDHTVLRPDATRDDVVSVCREAREFGFGAVCVAASWVPLAVNALGGTGSKVATVIGFPHGNTAREVKAFEAKHAVCAGALELDMVINIGALKSAMEQAVLDDIRSVVDEARQRDDVAVKVILETALLTQDEIRNGCRLAEEAGAHFVKTSTGFASSGANVEGVRLLRATVGQRLGVKAAGGIRDLACALALIEAGANRLGCSRSVAIMEAFEDR